MIKYILCYLFGHEKYKSHAFPDGNIIKTVDVLGDDLLTISIYKRCGKIYSNLIV